MIGDVYGLCPTLFQILVFFKQFKEKIALVIVCFQADFEQYYSVCRPSRCANQEDCSNTSNFSCLSDKGET